MSIRSEYWCKIIEEEGLETGAESRGGTPVYVGVYGTKSPEAAEIF